VGVATLHNSRRWFNGALPVSAVAFVMLQLIDWRFFERMKQTLLMARFENTALKKVP
jgi:hypothetical protein